MSHPFSSHKSNAVAKRRAQSMKGGADSGVGRMNKAAAIKAAPAPSDSGDMPVMGDMGKFARGGRAKGKGKKSPNTKINIAIIGGGKGGAGAPPDMGPALGAPPGPMPPPPGPAAGLPAPGGMPGAGGPPPMMPPKGPPGMPPGMMNRGGKVAMKGGAYSGEGRLDKIKAYGGKAKKG